MRTLLLSFILICSIAVKAQYYPPAGFMGYMHPTIGLGYYPLTSINPLNKKWSYNTYSGISTGFSFFNGGNATFVSAPVGIQVNRKLNNNLYAFAGASVAPSYINFGHSFLNSDISKGYPGNGIYRANNFGVNSRVEMGLMYINDAKTFSISGGIGVERSSYPMVPYTQARKTNTAYPAKN